MDAAMSAATTPSTRLLDNYVGGQWTPASGTDELDVPKPATGEVLARVPLSSASDLDAALRAAPAAPVSYTTKPDHHKKRQRV
jgi:malonate-semialdehyde dehydrogenase (acetylating)/methylmalonate-semialdehyde dehydrogenase